MNFSDNHELMDFLRGRNGNSISMVWTLEIAIMQKWCGNPRGKIINFRPKRHWVKKCEFN